MLTYEEVKNNGLRLKSLTGLNKEEFEELEKEMKQVWEREEEKRRAGKKRKVGGGRKGRLRTMEDKLLFILYYQKTYPLQEVMGALFGMSQGRANEWIQRLMRILKIALREGKYLPSRETEGLKETLRESLEQEYAIDGTERRRQRPKDQEEQKKYYSGKKKAHTYKNNLLVEISSRKVKYLSKTVEGKRHDKKLAEESELEFPPNSVLYQDIGFQGYEPEGVITRRPQKNRGEAS